MSTAVSNTAIRTPFYSTIMALCRRPGRDLSVRQLGVILAASDELKGQSVKAFAAHLGISKPAVTRAFDRLEADGLLVRSTVEHDRRLITVDLTSAGKRYAAGIGKAKP